MQIPSFGEKIVKIGPVDPEIALLVLKQEEINASEIYSPVGNLAQRAKKFGYISPICPETPHGEIFTKFCTAVEVVDVITCNKFLAIG